MNFSDYLPPLIAIAIVILLGGVVATFDTNQVEDIDIPEQIILPTVPEEEKEEIPIVRPFEGRPNDEYFNSQWSCFDTTISESWNITTGSKSIVVAVIDTGVDRDHEDLSDNMWINKNEILDGNDTDGNGYVDDIHGWNFVYNSTDVFDDVGHGTHCAGIIGAIGNNTVGVAGVCWNVSIMPLKAISSYGHGYIEWLTEAIYYATNNGADIISISWGSYEASSDIKTALHNAYNNSIVLIASAGNDGTQSMTYPASYPFVVAVGSNNKHGNISSFSNHGNWVDVYAPGEDILSTFPFDYYSEQSGTSMSAPYVSGVCGLLLSINNNIEREIIKTRLKATSNQGFINPYEMLIVPSNTSQINIIYPESLYGSEVVKWLHEVN